ncbi:MAG: hypothetical protein QOJ70_1473 [Acidobacteriota bacterium]|jgi:hypothetical protein|nr:hypothetical protein [Acidobacteriota bacterium]
MTSPRAELETILGRLRALDASAMTEDRTAAELALASYLSAYNVPRRPVRWATDAYHAYQLVDASEAWSEDDELSMGDERLRKIFREKGGPLTEAQMERAPDVSPDWSLIQFWHHVRRTVIGNGVSLSVPWYLYHPRNTPDRGRRVGGSGHWVWHGEKNVLQLLSWVKYDFNFWREETRLQQAVARLLLRVTRNLLDAYDAGLWMFWLTAAEIIALPRPVIVQSGGGLHCETGPAVSWPGSDQRYFFLNGVHVSEEIVSTPAERLDPRLMFFERNTGVRREIIRKVGIERVCETFNARSIDRQGDYELLLLDLRDGLMRPFLKMRNPSIGVYHIEGVAPECRTVAQALAWRNQSETPPSILT